MRDLGIQMAIHVNRPAISEGSVPDGDTYSPRLRGDWTGGLGTCRHGCLVQAQALPLCFLVGASLSGLYRMVALNGLQANEATDSQPLLVALSLINHSVNM